MKPPPPMPQLCGRATLSAKTVAAAASTALPPSARTWRPMRAAAGDSVAMTAVGDVTAGWKRGPSVAWAGSAARTRTSTAARRIERSMPRRTPAGAVRVLRAEDAKTVGAGDDGAPARAHPPRHGRRRRPPPPPPPSIAWRDGHLLAGVPRERRGAHDPPPCARARRRRAALAPRRLRQARRGPRGHAHP